MTCANRLHVSNAIPAATGWALGDAVAWRLRPGPETISDFVTGSLNAVLFENAPESRRKGRYRMSGRFPAPAGLREGDWLTLRLRWSHVLITDGEWSFGSGGWEQQASTSTVLEEKEQFVNVQIEEHASALSAAYQTDEVHVHPPQIHGRIYVFGPPVRGVCSAEVEQRVAVVEALGFAGYGGDGLWLTESAGGDGKPAVGSEPYRSYSGDRKFEWLPLQLHGSGVPGDLRRWYGGRWDYTDDWSEDAANPDYAKPFSSPILPAAFDPLPLRQPGIVASTNTRIHQVLVQAGGSGPIADDFTLTLSQRDEVAPLTRATAMMQVSEDVGGDDLFALNITDSVGAVLVPQALTPLPDGLVGACRFVGSASAALARIRYKVTYSIPAPFAEGRDFTFTWERVWVDWATGEESVTAQSASIHFNAGQTLEASDSWRHEGVPSEEGFVYLRNFQGPEDDAFYAGTPVAELVALRIIGPVPDIGRFGESTPAGSAQAGDFANDFGWVDGLGMGPEDEFNSDNLCEGCCDASSVMDAANLFTVTSDVSACGARRGGGTTDVPNGATTQLLSGGTFQGHYGRPVNGFNFEDGTYTFSGWHPNEPLACRGSGVNWAKSSCIIGAAGYPGAKIDPDGFEDSEDPPTQCQLHGGRGDPADGFIPAPWTGDGVNFSVHVSFDAATGCQQPTCSSADDPGKPPSKTSTNAEANIGITDFPYSPDSPCGDCSDADGQPSPCAVLPPGAPDVLMDAVEPEVGAAGVPSITGTWNSSGALNFSGQVQACLDFMSLNDLGGLYPDYENGVHVWVRGGADSSANTENTTRNTDAAAASVLSPYDPLTALASSVAASLGALGQIGGTVDSTASVAAYIASAVSAAPLSGSDYTGRAADTSQWPGYEMSAILATSARDVTSGLLNLQGMLADSPQWRINGIAGIADASPGNPSRTINRTVLGREVSSTLQGSSGLVLDTLHWSVEGKVSTLDPNWGASLGPIGTNSSLKIGSLEGSHSPKGSSGLLLDTLKGSDALQIGRLKGAGGLQIGSLKGAGGLQLSTLKIGSLQGSGLQGSGGLKLSKLKGASLL